MGYVLQLSDGSFVIYDGGFTADAENILNTLSGLTPAGTTPYIRAWILTHMHGDHYQAFVEFANNRRHRQSLTICPTSQTNNTMWITTFTKRQDFVGAGKTESHKTAQSLCRHGSALPTKLKSSVLTRSFIPGCSGLNIQTTPQLSAACASGGQTIIFPGDAQTLEITYWSRCRHISQERFCADIPPRLDKVPSDPGVLSDGFPDMGLFPGLKVALCRECRHSRKLIPDKKAGCRQYIRSRLGKQDHIVAVWQVK